MRFDPCAFPVCLSDGIDGSSARHPDEKIVIHDTVSSRMGSSPCRFTCNGGPLEILRVIGEFFGFRECTRTCQDVKISVVYFFPGNITESPKLLYDVVAAPFKAVQLCILLEKIAAYYLDCERAAALYLLMGFICNLIRYILHISFIL